MILGSEVKSSESEKQICRKQLKNLFDISALNLLLYRDSPPALTFCFLFERILKAFLLLILPTIQLNESKMAVIMSTH